MSEIDSFMNLVQQQIERKSKLYDGYENIGTGGLDSISRFMFSVIEGSILSNH